MATNPYNWASPDYSKNPNQQNSTSGTRQLTSSTPFTGALGSMGSSAGSNTRQFTSSTPPMGPNTGTYIQSSGKSFDYQPPFPSLGDFYGSLPGRVPGIGGFDEDFWRSQKSAGAFQAYSQNMMQPLMNYYLQSLGMDFQNQYNQAALNEQIRLNNLQHALAQAASSREERALAAQLGFNERDFAEMQRQFNQRFGLDERSLALQRELGLGELGLGQGRLDLDRLLGTGRLDLDRQLGMGRLDLDRQLGMGRLDLERQLGLGRLGLDERSLALQRELGLGELGLGRQRLDLDTRALQQEADLMRERLANEMIQARYAAFGRSQQPNFRMMTTF